MPYRGENVVSGIADAYNAGKSVVGLVPTGRCINVRGGVLRVLCQTIPGLTQALDAAAQMGPLDGFRTVKYNKLTLFVANTDDMPDGNLEMRAYISKITSSVVSNVTGVDEVHISLLGTGVNGRDPNVVAPFMLSSISRCQQVPVWMHAFKDNEVLALKKLGVNEMPLIDKFVQMLRNADGSLNNDKFAELVLVHHPDKGGDKEACQALLAARAKIK